MYRSLPAAIAGDDAALAAADDVPAAVTVTAAGLQHCRATASITLRAEKKVGLPSTITRKVVVSSVEYMNYEEHGKFKLKLIMLGTTRLMQQTPAAVLHRNSVRVRAIDPVKTEDEAGREVNTGSVMRCGSASRVM